MNDLYPRPSREAIAEMVKAQLPGADDSPPAVTRPEASAAANFAVHLTARLRALGWNSTRLVEKSGLSHAAVSRALNGHGASIDAAEKIAALVGGYLAAMIGPYMCATCTGEPPAGFKCLECGTEARAA